MSKNTSSAPRGLADSTGTSRHWHRLTIGEMFKRRREAGRAGLPVMSITMAGGLVERSSVERRVESNLPPEGHLLVRAGDLAYNMMRMWQGVLGRGRFDCLVSPAYIVLQPGELVDSQFAEYLFSSRQAIAQFKRLSYGVVDDRLRLYYRDLVRIPFDIPQRWREQQRIAEILATVDEALEQTKALIAKYEQIRVGLMHDLFTRGLGPDGQLRPTATQAPRLYKNSPLGAIPKAWSLVTLGKVAEIVSGVTLASHSEPKTGAVVPYLRVANVQDGYFDLTEIKTVKITIAQLEKLRLKSGDVLMNEGGDFDKLGRGAVWRGAIDPCVHQNHVFRVRPKNEELQSEFLAYWSQSEFGKKYFILSSKQSTNLASINASQLHRFPVVIPERQEQVAIQERLGASSDLIESLGNEVRKLKAIKNGVMLDLLTGRVRVLLP